MARDQVEIVFRPEDAAIHFAPMDGENFVRGIVEHLSFQGGTTECYLRIGDIIVRTVLHPSVETTHGAGAWLRIDTDRCVVHAPGQGR